MLGKLRRGLGLAVIVTLASIEAVSGCGGTSKSNESTLGDPAALAEQLAQATDLGREIHRRDMFAWWATDAALARLQVGDTAQWRGWVLDADDPSIVHFVAEVDGALQTGLLVTCDGTGAQGCEVEVPSSPSPLSDRNLAQLRAVTVAKDHPEFVPTSDRYNHVVIPADDSRWWVYLLAATTDPNLVMLGRHYRFLVSADGARVVEMRAFTESAMVLDRREAPNDAATFVVSHLLDDTPTEVHVWAALNYLTPIGVVTRSGDSWMIDATGAISRIEE